MKGDACPEDRISELADTIIHHILSFLETETIVSTSRLSKRWRYVWTTMPSFDLILLQYKYQEADTETVQNFIDRLLLFRQPSLKIIKFALTSDHVFDAFKVHEWISKIVSCNIEELSLDLCLYNDRIPFPRRLFNCESLAELRLHINMSLWIPGSISLPKLKLLQLSDIYFSNKLLVEQLILNSPLLEKLILSKCSWSNWNRTTLNISSPALKCLLIDDLANCIGIRNGTLKIHAPNLMHLSYTGSIATDYTVSSFSSLEDADICFKMECCYLDTQGAKIGHAAGKLVGGLSNVRSLTVSGETIEALSIAYDDLPTFQNLIHLRVTSEFGTFADKVLLKFFQSAPNLESLVFDKPLSMYQFDRGNTFCMQGECPLPRLKSVHFKEILAWSPREMDLIKQILKNAEDLEQMTFEDITPPTLSSISSLIKDKEEKWNDK
ncbi:hypothetical protein MKW92_041445 [Papaver armeniacum]|nr:hypothetical protein MKW92_041445 [Papaver armeniacum]